MEEKDARIAELEAILFIIELRLHLLIQRLAWSESVIDTLISELEYKAA